MNPTVRVHLYRLEPDRVRLAQAAAVLSPDERARAARYHRPVDRDCAVLARGILRRLLGTSLGCDPSALRFRYGPAGKPELAWPDLPLWFNVSHAGDSLLVGWSRDRDVGVDIEPVEPARVNLAVARRLFRPEVVQRLELATGQGRARIFFREWTRMEALVKAVGTGIAAGSPPRGPVRSFEVSGGYMAAVAIAAPR